MSIFQLETVPCPKCAASVEVDACYSVNADLRPDLLASTLDGAFQKSTCPACSSEFRLEPKLTWMDAGRGRWISARPAEELLLWADQEVKAKATFARISGTLSADVVPRLTFGWAALREKLLLMRRGLDDVAVELVKIAAIRDLDTVTFSARRALRFIDLRDDALIFAWVDDLAGADSEGLSIPVSTYTAVRTGSGWDPLRRAVSVGPFVDARRLMLA